MVTCRRMVLKYRWLGAMFLLVAVTSTTVISCGSGGGDSSHGELCDQCGQTDGACRPDLIDTSSGDPCPTPSPIVTCTSSCPAPSATPTCTASSCPTPTGPNCVHLICRRKSDSAQQRCYPAANASPGSEVDFSFRCDGSRPGHAQTPGPDPTETVEPSPEPATCPNGEREGDEDCDGTDFGENGCRDFCTIPIGIFEGFLGCNNDCTLNFSGCTAFDTCRP